MEVKGEEMLNGLSLFTGIGGIDIALEQWIKPMCYCEIEPYCQAVLLSRMVSKDISSAPIWDDISTLTKVQLPGCIDILYGGFPCQDLSVAGHGKGLAGKRSGLFFEIMRLVREIRPRFVFLENVPAIRTRGLDTVLKEFTKARYDCRWTMLSASDVGALHKRERWFLLAYAKHDGTSSCEDRGSLGKKYEERVIKQAEDSRETKRASCISRDVANTECEGLEGHRQPGKQKESESRIKDTFRSIEDWKKAVSGVCRTSDGVQFQVDKLKCLGNSVVPQQVKEAFEILMGLK